MAKLTFASIENYLSPYRSAGRRIKTILLEQIVADQDIRSPFLMLSRFFMRLKSADSILEKIERKGLAVQSTVEIGQKIDDLLGFRIITSNLDELHVLDQFLSERFTVHAWRDMVDPPENMDIDQSNTNYLSQVASSRSLSRFSYGLFYSIAGPAAHFISFIRLSLSGLCNRSGIW